MLPDKETEGLSRLRAQAQEAARAYAEEAEVQGAFKPGETPVSVGGRIIGGDEAANMVGAALDGWLTEGRWADAFRERLPAATGRSSNALVGSGSQANLLAITALTSHLVDGRLNPGDEVITPAVGFPTTVNPIYQNGLVPVFIDVDPETFNPSLDDFEAAISPSTRAVVAAHGLGNPFDAAGLRELCDEHGLHLIEDCCDALGSTLGGKLVGTFGSASTYSFYPAHHMTTGEGGAVGTDREDWGRAVSSLREWGRDCWCPPGVNDACGHRFEGTYGQMPEGYDHKYVFGHVGYNFKITDMQAALGIAQLDRLEGFHAARRRNFSYLHDRMKRLEDRLILPRSLAGADPSWFGYPFTLREGGSRERRLLQVFLDGRKIDSRLLLAGNMTRQPAYLPLNHRISGTLTGADRITDSSAWIGCHPALTEPMMDWMVDSIEEFLTRN